MLRKLDRDIWAAEQPLRYLGFSVGTRMTVVRLANGELAVISPIQISETLVSELSNIGTVSHIIAPNLYHYLFVADFKARYPQATFWAAPGLAVKQPELSIDQTIDRSTNSIWEELEFVFFEGFRTLGLGGIDSFNECVFFHPPSRTLILTDTAFHFDNSFPFLTQLAFKVTGSYKQLSPSLLEKIATTDKETVRKAVNQVLAWDFERVVMAHGTIIDKGGKAQFKQGYERFLGSKV